VGASTALRFLAANFADELLGELFYLPYGRIGEVAGATYMSCLRGAIFRMAVCALEYVALFLHAENVWGVLFLAFAISA